MTEFRPLTVRDAITSFTNNIVAASIYNEVYALVDPLPVDFDSSTGITPIYRESPEGNRIYKRSIAFLLAAAVHNRRVSGNFSIGECIGDSFVFRLSDAAIDSMTATDIENNIRELILLDLFVTKLVYRMC